MKRNTTFKDQRSLTERRHAKPIDALHRAEDDLARALTRWLKARKTVRRYDKRADHDWRQLAQSADKIKHG